MEDRIIFNKKNNSKSFILNPEQVFFKITRIEIPSIPMGSLSLSSLLPKFVLSYSVQNTDQKITTGKIDGLLSYITANHREAKFDINQIIASNVDERLLEFKYESESEIDVVIYYTQFNKKVDFANPFESFNIHIKQNDNTKILFSAPFGQGKTTFLNHYFDTHQNQYEVFKLYPVNYAVSHNEDIFKYIKAELLFQLLGKDVEFEKLKFTYLDTAPAFFKKNVQNILSPFIALLPAIGKSASDIYEKLYKLATEYLDYHAKIQVDDKNKALQFIHDLYEKEGSIFEDNFYTQLIRQLLEQHKQEHTKQNVLIIDDIDRMDPDHIFRIFNVFSANFDSSDFKNGYTNKFGFDKIILVCDYHNIKRLFVHRYGSNAAFEGYLSKYYSKKPFEYDNTKAVEAITKELSYHRNQPIESLISKLLVFLVNDLVSTNEITLRDLLNLLKYNFYNTIDEQSNMRIVTLNTSRHYLIYFNIIAFLEKIFEEEAILEKFRRVRNKPPIRNKVNYKYYAELGFIPLIKSFNIEKENSINFLSDNFTFNVKHQNDHPLNYSYYQAVDVVSKSSGTNFDFNARDFYDILILNVEQYIQHKK